MGAWVHADVIRETPKVAVGRVWVYTSDIKH